MLIVDSLEQTDASNSIQESLISKLEKCFINSTFLKALIINLRCLHFLFFSPFNHNNIIFIIIDSFFIKKKIT